MNTVFLVYLLHVLYILQYLLHLLYIYNIYHLLRSQHMNLLTLLIPCVSKIWGKLVFKGFVPRRRNRILCLYVHETHVFARFARAGVLKAPSAP